MFIVEKRDGRIKARKCAVGSKQRTFEGYNKADWASPTVSTDGVLITSAIEAHEGRHIATCDLPNAYLNTDNNEETIMLLKGELAELMVQVDPKLYQKYVTTSKKGEAMLMSASVRPRTGFCKARFYSTISCARNWKIMF